MSGTVTVLHKPKHQAEQQAYEEIRRDLSAQFIEDPVKFMQTHGKRPEDLGGAYLRMYYREAVQYGLEAKAGCENFCSKFRAGHFFKEIVL